MKPFSLERAKAGDPIMVRASRHSSEWYSGVKFIGTNKHGHPILEWGDGDVRNICDFGDRLRMAPIKRTVYMNIMEGGPAAWFISAYAANVADHAFPVIARAVPIEIED